MKMYCVITCNIKAKLFENCQDYKDAAHNECHCVSKATVNIPTQEIILKCSQLAS
jgi:hypothetical protein